MELPPDFDFESGAADRSARCPCVGVSAMVDPAHPLDGCLNRALCFGWLLYFFSLKCQLSGTQLFQSLNRLRYFSFCLQFLLLS